MIWSETAEQLKQELTDKYVVVMDGVPELKRFVGRAGMVKTVNMSGRALVQFESNVDVNFRDVSWYDIDPTYLTVVDAPLPKTKVAHQPASPKAAEKTAPKPAGKAKGGLSPLELARQQGAGGAAAKPKTAAGDKKLSPLELARQQGAAGGSAPSKPSAPAPSPKQAGDQKLSPLELARQQGAAKSSASSSPEPVAETPAVEEAVAVVEEAAPETTAKPTPPAPVADTSGLSKIELARRQGAFKG